MKDASTLSISGLAGKPPWVRLVMTPQNRPFYINV
jgi:hypothetical protein